MSNGTGASSKTVLILAPTANDGALAVSVLAAASLSATACTSIDDLCQRIEDGCGAVLISEEALTSEGIVKLRGILDGQEPWSDLPIILLTSADVVRATEIFSKSGNISLLERPFSQLTLIRSVEVALRARAKQYEVRGLLEELRRSKDEAERANTAKSQFLANMSHEIRTPIGAITGFIDLIKSSKIESDENLGYMEIIERNSQQLLRLIDDILDLSKVEAGKMSIEKISFKLNEFLADFSSNMTFRAAEKGLRFRMTLSTDIPDSIVSDPVRLRQILSNIVGNAIKFTAKGSVEMSVSWQAPLLTFLVRDTGIGLSPKQASNLFRPFAQADASTTRRFGGTGLGLVLSRKLAQSLGGNLELVRSEPGAGSTFAASIQPVTSSDSVMISRAGMDSEPSLRTQARDHALEGLNVLLVEDSEDNQILISTYLRKTGARIDVKGNGAEGVRAALNRDYDLILMDVQMPVMDGHEAVRKLRNQHYEKPIIALTAHAMSDERQRCLASGFTDYLTKPIQRDLLIDALSRYASVPEARTLQ